jgi:hypothetical protein
MISDTAKCFHPFFPVYTVLDRISPRSSFFIYYLSLPGDGPARQLVVDII